MDDQGVAFQKLREEFLKNPNDAAHELAYGKALFDDMENGKRNLGNVCSALHLLRNATIRQPENHEAHEYLGNAYMFFERFGEAARCFNRAEALRETALNGHEAAPHLVLTNV